MPLSGESVGGEKVGELQERLIKLWEKEIATEYKSKNMTKEQIRKGAEENAKDELEIVGEAKKELPTRRDYLEAMKYVELGFKDGEVKDFLLRVLKESKDVLERWFGE